MKFVMVQLAKEHPLFQFETSFIELNQVKFAIFVVGCLMMGKGSNMNFLGLRQNVIVEKKLGKILLETLNLVQLVQKRLFLTSKDRKSFYPLSPNSNNTSSPTTSTPSLMKMET
ncbi:9217_t:CDS:2 [Ambispora leptoticha]|uniref:9217_t:CDS:1 n=1 Tax=Ambispora leptoticha TaxID=144679 RepID=A0A9N9GG14_9GLOM|nr:9217_t:CDS:2 [Ambispora leptoticha]